MNYRYFLYIRAYNLVLGKMSSYEKLDGKAIKEKLMELVHNKLLNHCYFSLSSPLSFFCS